MSLTDAFTLTSDPRWALVETAMPEAAAAPGLETATALSNGYAGTRVALGLAHSGGSPTTLVAGLWGRGRSGQPPHLAAAPDWLDVQVTVDDQALALETCELLDSCRTLDMRQGVLQREWRLRDTDGRVSRLQSLCFASLADRHSFVHVLHIMPENYSASLKITHQLAKPIGPFGVLETRKLGGGALLQLRAPESAVTLACATNATLTSAEHAPYAPETVITPESVGMSFQVEAEPGEIYTFASYTAMFGTQDGALPEEAAEAKLGEMVAATASKLLDQHTAAWAECWRDSDIELAGNDALQRDIRWSIFQLAGAAWQGSEQALLGRSGLTSHHGHGWADGATEALAWPFFCFTAPQTARALLIARFRNLPEAHTNAESEERKGVRFAWVSADTGEELAEAPACVPDIAGLVLRYRQATHDDTFFREYGAELLLSSAQYWVTRAYVGADSKYHLDADQLATVSARQILRRAVDSAAELQVRKPAIWQDLLVRLNLSVSDMTQWQRVAAGLPRPRAGVAIDDTLRPLVAALGAPGASPASPAETALRALLEARRGSRTIAERSFRAAIAGSTKPGQLAEGVALGAVGGIWQALVFGFLGINPQDEGLRFRPMVPQSWGSLKAGLLWQGARLHVLAEPSGAVVLAHEEGQPIQVAVGEGSWQTLRQGETTSIQAERQSGA